VRQAFLDPVAVETQLIQQGRTGAPKIVNSEGFERQSHPSANCRRSRQCSRRWHHDAAALRSGILSYTAKLITPFVNLALVPEAASSWLLPARIGHVRAYAMFALGEPPPPHWPAA
jgi:hypothetical protein